MLSDEDRSLIIDTTMRKHPYVRDSLTLVSDRSDGDSGDSQFVTFLVPDMELAIQAGYGPDPTENWRHVWNVAYGTSGPPSPPDLNLKGWSSSYTRQPMPEDEMLQWIHATVSSITATGARTFCEIGCGTGLLLFRLAPDCDSYLGLDIAETAVELVAHEVGLQNLADRVKLEAGTASDIAAVAGQRRFDCVIFNSTAQYFPDEEYLTHAMLAAASVVVPGGFIFIGDVRHKGLADAFYASVSHEPGLPTQDLVRRVHAIAAEERELLIDPGYFTKLRHLEPLVTGVQISLKPSGPDNELTRFRYDVLVQVNGLAPGDSPKASADWDLDVGSVACLREMLDAAEDEFVIDGIPNSRVAPFFALLGGDPTQSSGVSVEELSSAAAAHGWQAHLDWSPGQRTGRIRALFHRRDRDARRPRLLVNSCPPVVEPVVNCPRQAALLRSIPLAAKSWARGRLPAALELGIVRAVPALPVTSSGVADRDALRAAARIA